MFIESLLNFLKMLDSVESSAFTMANQTTQNLAFPTL